MKFGDIIKYFDMTGACKIYQTDVYINKDEIELIFEGSIMDIPWYLMNFILDNEGDGEAIAVIDNKFYIYVKEGRK